MIPEELLSRPFPFKLKVRSACAAVPPLLSDTIAPCAASDRGPRRDPGVAGAMRRWSGDNTWNGEGEDKGYTGTEQNTSTTMILRIHCTCNDAPFMEGSQRGIAFSQVTHPGG